MEKKILAKVGQKEITNLDVQSAIQGLDPYQAQQFQTEEGQKYVLDDLINQELLYMYAKDNKITLDYKVLNRNGEKLKPKQIVIKSNRSDEAMDLSLDELVDENGVISFDISNFDKYVHSIYLVYEDEKDNFLTQSLYMFDVR